MPGLCSLLLIMTFGALADRVETDAKGVPLAAPEATVDRVAYSYQRNAIDRMEQLIAAGKMADQEAAMLERLARLQWEHAEITFRIAHAEAYANKKAIAMSAYHQVLGQLVGTTTKLIDKHKTSAALPSAYLLRGKAHTELGQKDQAYLDYKTLVDRYPKAPMAANAYVALGEYAFQAQRFSEAIQHFEKLLQRKQDVEYPYALRRLAWSYYNLSDLKTAFRYLKEYLLSQDKATLEADVFEDIAAFYIQGLEKQLPDYGVQTALGFFEKMARELGLGEAGVDVGIVQFTKLLRAKNRATEIATWRKIILNKRPLRPSIQDALAIIHENELNLNRYDEAVTSAQEIASLGKSDRAKSVLLGTVARLQEAIKNSKSDENRTRYLYGLLAKIYTSYLALQTDLTADVIQTQFNLAETYAFLGEHSRAHEEYSKILARAKAAPQLLLQAKLKPEDLVFKTIATQYESLKKRKIFPEVVRAAEPSQHEPKATDPEFARWSSLLKSASTDRRVAFYQYERMRARYSAGYVREELEELLWFVREYQDSAYTVPSAELALDTLVLGKDWKRVLEVVNEFKKYRFKDPKLLGRLNQLGGDATYKMAEAGFNSGQADAVLADAEKTLKTLEGQPERKADFLMIQAKAAVSAKQDAKIVQATQELIRMPASISGKYKAEAFLLRGAVWERSMELSAAMGDYSAFVRTGAAHPSRNIVAKKVLLYTWLFNDYRGLRSLVQDPLVCRDIAQECRRYEELAYAIDTPASRTPAQRQEVLRFSKSQALFALLALEQEAGMKLNDRLERVKVLAEQLKSVDPLVQFAMMERVAKLVPSVFSLSRSETARLYPVRADQASVERRLKMVRYVEAVGTRVLSLPWARVRAEVLSEVGALYGDLGADVRRIPAPKGLAGPDLETFRQTMEQISEPYLQTSLEFQQKAFEMASHSGIEDQAYRVILRRLKSQSPEFAAESVARRGLASAAELAPEFYRRVQVDPNDSKKPFGKVVDRWREAFARKNYVFMGYLIQNAPSMAGYSPTTAQNMRAASLALAGAQSEALSEFEKQPNQTGGAPADDTLDEETSP